ncbi:hypothetical protein PROFUN_08911 [Planoprotostelium fungivorum]|uniref:Uncharacterized protein n=1 Tax=Planoprotostelium fungivorum TaxID=1890364 RepID=A0A2P6NIU9_9EUKA|nr:hypothetical protein PROFUN_08911 [Planoprotostelium fungivorum]
MSQYHRHSKEDTVIIFHSCRLRLRLTQTLYLITMITKSDSLDNRRRVAEKRFRYPQQGKSQEEVPTHETSRSSSDQTPIQDSRPSAARAQSPPKKRHAPLLHTNAKTNGATEDPDTFTTKRKREEGVGEQLSDLLRTPSAHPSEDIVDSPSDQYPAFSPPKIEPKRMRISYTPQHNVTRVPPPLNCPMEVHFKESPIPKLPFQLYNSHIQVQLPVRKDDDIFCYDSEQIMKEFTHMRHEHVSNDRLTGRDTVEWSIRKSRKTARQLSEVYRREEEDFAQCFDSEESL